MRTFFTTHGPDAGLDIEVAGQANGTIHIDLFEDIAPKHVAQITAIAAEGGYDGVYFHRVIDGFMAQTGDVEFAKAGGDMARAQNPNSANSQFFIMFAPGHFLNRQYTVVGTVTEGMEIVDQIKLGDGPNGAVIGEPDVMVKVTVTE